MTDIRVPYIYINIYCYIFFLFIRLWDGDTLKITEADLKTQRVFVNFFFYEQDIDIITMKINV